MSVFPQLRLRRLRKSEGLRRLVRETRLDPGSLIYPLFVIPGRRKRVEVVSMPGVYQLSPELVLREAEEAMKLGVPAVLLFGVPERKDALGSEAYNPRGIVPQAIRSLKGQLPELIVAVDVCLCAYTDHGHCGVVVDGYVDNDRTLELISRMALTLARAGADIVAPSGMMDGQVEAIRSALDENGLKEVLIMAYSAKHASSFYGPFREAAHSAPQFGDRRSYQMDAANAREALREVEQDILEGADIVMVKPALAYLDIILRVKEAFPVPLAAYNVSGEYSMVKAAAREGWLEERAAVLETLTAIKRAGADMLITYHAKEAARWLSE